MAANNNPKPTTEDTPSVTKPATQSRTQTRKPSAPARPTALTKPTATKQAAPPVKSPASKPAASKPAAERAKTAPQAKAAPAPNGSGETDILAAVATLEETAQKYHIKKKTIRKAIKNGRLPAREAGKVWLIRREDARVHWGKNGDPEAHTPLARSITYLNRSWY